MRTLTPPMVLAAALLAACQRDPAPAPAAPPTAAAPAAAIAATPPATAANAATAATGESRPFEVRLEPPASVRAGQPATARILLTAKGGYHVNRDYPLAFRPEPASVAAFGGERIALGEGVERTPCAGQAEDACALSAPLTLTVPAGQATLAGTFAFSVCTAQVCLIEKAPLSMAVTAR